MGAKDAGAFPNLEKQGAQRKGRMPDLRTTGPSLREPKLEEALMLSTWWANKEAAIKAHVADGDRFGQLKGMFLRGTSSAPLLLCLAFT